MSSLTCSLNWHVSNPYVGFYHVLPKLKRLKLLDFHTIEGLSACLNSKPYSPWALQKLILLTVKQKRMKNIVGTGGIGGPHQNTRVIRKPAIPHLIVLLNRAKNIKELCITDYIGLFSACVGGFEKCIYKGLTLHQLQSISYTFSRKLGADAVLLRFLLGCSPALVNLNIVYSKCLNLKARKQVEKRISKFDRASPNVKVRYFHR